MSLSNPYDHYFLAVWKNWNKTIRQQQSRYFLVILCCSIIIRSVFKSFTWLSEIWNLQNTARYSQSFWSGTRKVKKNGILKQLVSVPGSYYNEAASVPLVMHAFQYQMAIKSYSNNSLSQLWIVSWKFNSTLG